MSVSHGIEKMQFTDAPAGGKFPASSVWKDTNTATLFNFRKIKVGSFSESKDADETTDIEVEDMDNVFMTISGKKGKQSFEVESYDLSDEALKYFLGYAAADTAQTDLTGYLVKPVKFEMPRQCMRIVDRKIEGKDRKEWLYMPCKVVGEIGGTRSKTELRTIKLSITLEANMDATGNELPNEANKVLA